ncbi:hypothetical protein EJ110_NYTH50932 [Nymphaea thermarum]|nr:hypothetical protein EJ110_NYTH50932 [Nymphaea thermarum]
MGIAGRGRIAYVNGRKVEPVEGSIAWDTWYLEDNQVKMWIINFASSDIQPLILRKKTATDMWVILEHMYGQKKRKDLHPEKKNSKGRPSASKQRESSVTGPGDRKGSFSAEQLRELRAYLSQADGGQTEKSDDVKGNQALAVSGTEGTSYVGEWIVDSGATHHMTGNPKLFHDYKLSSGKERVLDKDKEDISAEAHELGKKEEEVEKDVPPMVTEQVVSYSCCPAESSFKLMKQDNELIQFYTFGAVHLVRLFDLQDLEVEDGQDLNKGSASIVIIWQRLWLAHLAY